MGPRNRCQRPFEDVEQFHPLDCVGSGVLVMQNETEVMLALWWLQIIRKVLVTWWTGSVLRIFFCVFGPRDGHQWLSTDNLTLKHHSNGSLIAWLMHGWQKWDEGGECQLPLSAAKVYMKEVLWHDMTPQRNCRNTRTSKKKECASASDVCPLLEES